MRFPLAIIPAGGKGTRMGPGPPKVLRLVNGEPLIRHVVRFWGQRADHVMVVSQDEAAVCEALGTEWGVLYEPHPKGTCAAVLHALRATRCPERFVVSLGDCLFDGEFAPMPETPFTGIAVQHQDASEWGRSYAAGRERGIVEKPTLGLGAYFLTWHDLWALEDNGGITEAMVDLEARKKVERVRFEGAYRNCTYAEDLEKW